MKVIKHWNRLLREVLDGNIHLETCKVRLDGPLSNLMWLRVSLPTAGRVD